MENTIDDRSAIISAALYKRLERGPKTDADLAWTIMNMLCAPHLNDANERQINMSRDIAKVILEIDEDEQG